MLSRGVCRSPVCKDCDDDEYMDTYTNKVTCERQPYCDPNSNFELPESTSKTKRHQCLCKVGFHCSSVSCITCVPHTECEPGSGATIKGNQTHDTVCETCPDGTFSNEKSWNGTCEKINGLNHAHVGLIVAAVLIAVAAVVGAVYHFRCKGRTGHEPLKKPIGIVDDYNSDLSQIAIEDEEKGNPYIATPTDDGEDREEPRTPTQESAYHSGPPEETEDVVLTANGDVLSQDGKEHVISQPETQAITIN